jgi:PleD family two-component response regulator
MELYNFTSMLIIDQVILTSLLRNIRVELSTRIERVKLPVTFSIGLVTYEAPPESIEQVLGQADSLMYSVKRSGKDGIMSMTWRGKEKGAYQLTV